MCLDRSRNAAPRFWFFFIGLLFISFVWIYTVQGNHIHMQNELMGDLDREQQSISDDNASLARKIAFSETNEFIIREAHNEYDLLGKDETLFKSSVGSGNRSSR